MVEPYQTFVAPIIAQVGMIWPLPVFLACSALLTLATPWVRGKLGEARVRKRLARIWSEALHDVILPASRGGLTQVDHLVLTGAGLLVVETKNYRGRIFGREQEAQWTQRLGRHSIAFPNPLRQNHGHTEAVKALVAGRAGDRPGGVYEFSAVSPGDAAGRFLSALFGGRSAGGTGDRLVSCRPERGAARCLGSR